MEGSTATYCSRNYGPRSIHITGRVVPYSIGLHGLVFADGRTFVNHTTADQPMKGAAAVSVPGCRTCHGGC